MRLRERSKGHPASEEELKQTFHAAELLSHEDGLALNSVICCSGNGHYVLAPLVPIPVDSFEVARQFKQFGHQIAREIADHVKDVKIDPVYNRSRVMRLMGTWNSKGFPVAGRLHRRAHFITNLPAGRSIALHHMILNTDVDELRNPAGPLLKGLRCDLRKLENCQFIQWCRAYLEHVSEPLWWALITNLAYLEGGISLIHEISRLDMYRYDHCDTERVIQRVINSGYKPVLCKTLSSQAMTCSGRGRFQCSQINQCPARSPMFMAALHTI